MSIPSDHKALIFIGAVAVLGAAVRVTRAAAGSGDVPQPALDHQIQASDSAARAGRTKARGKSPRAKARARASQAGPAGADPTGQGRSSPLLDRSGYVGSRLDMDVATAAQIDSLPGVTPAMARRIVADRMNRGPFLSLDGLRRVSGAGPLFVQRIDSLVTFSGVYRPGTPADTVIPKRRSRGRSKSPP
jgi:DNA uptake protein ComE-like DNA-binding protein